MHVIGILHGKGGVGTSTIAVNLVRALQLRDWSVALIDCDAQSTSQHWKASRSDPEALPPVFSVGAPDSLRSVSAPSSLQSDVRSLSGSFDAVVIDGRATLERLHVAIVETSDLALIPVQPSPADIWPSEDIARIIRKRQDTTGRPEAAFVISRRRAGTQIGRVESVLEGYDLPVWAGTCDRAAYVEAMGEGRSVVEMSDEEAAQEIETLTDNVVGALTDRE